MSDLSLMQMALRAKDVKDRQMDPADAHEMFKRKVWVPGQPARVRPARIESVVVSVAGLPTATPIASTTLQTMIGLGTDSKIDRVECNLLYANSGTQDFKHRRVTGRWTIFMFQIQRDNQYVRLTQPIQVMDPRGEPFLLGSTVNRMQEGRPIYLRLDYEAGTALAGHVVFWANADNLAITITTS